MAELTDARRRANKKWDDANKDRKRYIQKRSVAKSFIKNDSTAEDIDDLQSLLDERRAELKY
ncbi:hypothetical protein [Lacticaseibacillus songhuajiangensis]|jgi:hypothetical protein|uniref:hypothetical protein n=1 Tax=Lacticaseibacillus songhuajiangensis TaxID=1296539 RepID=UPI000F770098|nr:hypothetical protein [Lacticaseibacillus songhuajiangensis]